MILLVTHASTIIHALFQAHSHDFILTSAEATAPAPAPAPTPSSTPVLAVVLTHSITLAPASAPTAAFLSPRALPLVSATAPAPPLKAATTRASTVAAAFISFLLLLTAVWSADSALLCSSIRQPLIVSLECRFPRSDGAVGDRGQLAPPPGEHECGT
eukprot:scaffold131414_cov30-Tisochrysis_lutea.AAC.3